MSVYVWGKGDSGRLGLGNLKDALDPVTIEGFRGNIVNISSGEMHSLAVNEYGDVYAWGRGKDGQLGNGKKINVLTSPQKVTTLDGERIRKVVCGPFHCMAINQEGEIFEWGMLHRFQDSGNQIFGGVIDLPGMKKMQAWEEKRQQMLERSVRLFLDAGQTIEDKESIGNTNEVLNFGNFVTYLQTTPLLVEGLQNTKIVDVAAGYAFNIAISSEGLVYGWGFNEKKQLGLGHRYNQEHPVLIKSLVGVPIKQVACGQQHVLALSEEGQVYSWGMGVFGQLGHGNLWDQGQPKLIESLQNMKVVQVACGSNHCMALTEDGKIFTWGSSEYGQQGGKNEYTDWQEGDQHSHGRRKNYYTEPREITDAFDGKRIVNIACGCLHNCALTDTGEIYTWGWGISGALGHGDTRFLLFPRVVGRLRGERLIYVTASTHMTMAVTATAVSTFALDFKHLVNKNSWSDLKFVLQGKEIVSHKAIVFARCPALYQEILSVKNKATLPPPPEAPSTDTDNSTLENTTGEENNSDDETNAPKEVLPTVVSCEGDVVTINNLEYFVFLAFLRYLYTDQVTAPLHHVPRLEMLGGIYKLPRLVLICKRLLLFREAPIFGGDISSLPQEPIPPSSYATDMISYLNNKEHADIVFTLSDESQIHAHKIVLTSRSDYFRTIFESSFKESDQSQISMKELDRNIFLELLRFMYTNDISEIGDQVVDILMASGRFLLDDLKKKIEKHLEDQLDVENVLELLLLSESTSTPKLRKACINILVDHLLEHKDSPTLNDIGKNSPNTIKHIEYLYRKKYDPNFKVNDLLREIKC